MFSGVTQECTPFPTLLKFFDLITSKVPTLFRSMEKIGYVDDVALPPVMQRFSTDPQEVRNFNRPDPLAQPQPTGFSLGLGILGPIIAACFIRHCNVFNQSYIFAWSIWGVKRCHIRGSLSLSVWYPLLQWLFLHLKISSWSLGAEN